MEVDVVMCRVCAKPVKSLGEQLRGSCNLCDLFAGGEMLPSQTPAAWPKTSYALACLPNQVEEKMAFDKLHGVPTEYKKTPDGYAAEPVFTDRGHRKRYMKAHGCHDNSGGYGD